MKTPTLALLLTLGLTASASAQTFQKVQYRGGDQSQSKKASGILILMADRVEFYECSNQWWCKMNRPVLTMPLAAILAVSADLTESLLRITYRTPSTVEVPAFEVNQAEIGAVEAKIRFQLTRAGLTLKETP